MVTADTILASLALIISIVGVVLQYQLSWKSAAAAERPLLVFEYDVNAGWMVRNCGNGPAVNVLLMFKGDCSDSEWLFPLRIPAVGSGSDFELSSIGHINVRTLGAWYEDFSGSVYWTESTDDKNTFRSGRRYPALNEADVKRAWDPNSKLIRHPSILRRVITSRSRLEAYGQLESVRRVRERKKSGL